MAEGGAKQNKRPGLRSGDTEGECAAIERERYEGVNVDTPPSEPQSPDRSVRLSTEKQGLSLSSGRTLFGGLGRGNWSGMDPQDHDNRERPPGRRQSDPELKQNYEFPGMNRKLSFHEVGPPVKKPVPLCLKTGTRYRFLNSRVQRRGHLL
jgi:hypothetical protein